MVGTVTSNNLHLSGGVGRKIFAAFLAVSLFSLASALVGWVGLGFVREAQDEVLSEVYPSVRNAQTIAQESTVLVLQISSLFEARSVAQLTNLVNKIGSREQNISALLAGFDSKNRFGELRGLLEPKIADLSEYVETSAKLSRETIEISDRLDQSLVVLLSHTDGLIDTTTNLASIVSEKTINDSDTLIELLRSGGQTQSENRAEEFEAFLQQNIGDLQKITDLQFRSEAIRDQLVRLADIVSIDQARVLRDDLILNVRAITNGIVRLRYAGEQQVFAEPLTGLSEHIFQEDNIFWRKEVVLANRITMNTLQNSAETTGQAIGALVEQIVAETESVMQDQSVNARDFASQTQFALVFLAILAFVSSILIFVVYVNNNLLVRLQRLASSVSRLAERDFSRPVDATGNDQITRLEEAVEAFRGNSILLKQAESDLLARSEELERSNTDLQQFAYVTSHDLRAPLRAIDSLSQWIQEDLAEGNTAEVSDNLDRLRSRVSRMDSLLNGILLYARAGSKDTDNEHIPFDEIVRQIFDDLNPDERFTLKVRTESDTIFTGSSFFQQCLGNLITNAMKHHDKPRGIIEVELVSDPLFNKVLVSDDGPGIPENLRSRIFKMFQTLKPRDEVEASGIGLALVKRLIERRSGTISVGQAKLGGACFILQWPREGY